MRGNVIGLEFLLYALIFSDDKRVCSVCHNRTDFGGDTQVFPARDQGHFLSESLRNHMFVTKSGALIEIGNRTRMRINSGTISKPPAAIYSIISFGVDSLVLA